jgi:hypothetical protein
MHFSMNYKHVNSINYNYYSLLPLILLIIHCQVIAIHSLLLISSVKQHLLTNNAIPKNIYKGCLNFTKTQWRLTMKVEVESEDVLI